MFQGDKLFCLLLIVSFELVAGQKIPQLALVYPSYSDCSSALKSISFSAPLNVTRTSNPAPCSSNSISFIFSGSCSLSGLGSPSALAASQFRGLDFFYRNSILCQNSLATTTASCATFPKVCDQVGNSWSSSYSCSRCLQSSLTNLNLASLLSVSFPSIC